MEVSSIFLQNKGDHAIAGVARSIAARLASLVDDDGRFRYEFGGDLKTVRPEAYNVLRHAGCVWMLREAQKAGISGTGEAAARSAAYLVSRYVTMTERGVHVVEDGVTRLGGNGLALLALLDGTRETAAEAPNVAEHLMLFLAGELRAWPPVHKRDALTWLPIPFESEYYLGEALFAAAEWSRRHASSDILGLIERYARRLADDDYGVRQQSHWMLYALASLFSTSPATWILRYQERIVQAILADESYRTRGSIPVACRTEGLLCYLRSSLQSDDADGQMQRAVLGALQQNLRIQAGFIRDDGVVWRGHASRVTRIDALQHCLAGFLDSYEVMAALTGI